jgi:arylsulfatase A-like enzyme
LRESKAYAYEGGVRVPYFIAGPGIPAGKHIDRPVTGMDFYPTILDIIDVPLKPEQHVDGISLKPLLRGSGETQQRSLYWHYPHYHRSRPYGAVLKENFKLIEFFQNGQVELYNLRDDPYETRNLVGKKPEIAADMLIQLQAWRVGANAQMMEPNPYYRWRPTNKGKRRPVNDANRKR